jgi:hypothetical protein
VAVFALLLSAALCGLVAPARTNRRSEGQEASVSIRQLFSALWLLSPATFTLLLSVAPCWLAALAGANRRSGDQEASFSIGKPRHFSPFRVLSEHAILFFRERNRSLLSS